MELSKLSLERLEGVDLILSAGDLPAEYLSFLTCFTSVSILPVSSPLILPVATYFRNSCSRSEASPADPFAFRKIFFVLSPRGSPVSRHTFS